MSELLDASLLYASQGWPVSPTQDTTCGLCSCGRDCDSPGKHPRTVNGLKDATTDRAVITTWWRQWPTANVAIATGTASIDVLDVDVKLEGSGFIALRRLSRAGLIAGACALVRTQAGGAHLYFRPNGQGNSTIRGQYLDLRGQRGYVLAPPSAVTPGVYELVEWRPEATGQLDWAAVKRLLAPLRPRLASMSSLAGSSIERLAAWLAGQPAQPGNRNHALYWAACRAVEDGARESDLELLISAAQVIGLSEVEATKTALSALHRLAGVA